MAEHVSQVDDSIASDSATVAERMTPKAVWTLAITSVAVFMVTLDNLVVTTAIPVIRQDLHASLSGLQWTVNAYTLTFAVLLLTGAALGDRFGRRRLLAVGVAIFTAASAAAALAPSIIALDVARALQGVGGAIVMPWTLTVLSAAVPAARLRRTARPAGPAQVRDRTEADSQRHGWERLTPRLGHDPAAHSERRATRKRGGGRLPQGGHQHEHRDHPFARRYDRPWAA